MKWEGSFPFGKSVEAKKAQGPTKSRMKTWDIKLGGE